MSNWLGTDINDYFKGNMRAFIGQPVRVRPELKQLPKAVTVYNGIAPSGTTYGEVTVVNAITNPGSISLQKGETAIFDFGQNFVGWIKFKVKGTSGTKLTGRFAEMLNDSGDAARGNDNAKGTLYLKNLRSAKATLLYILNGNAEGEIYSPSMTYFGFRYCEISATDDIVIESMTGEVVGNTNEENSAFTTNNALVNKLYSNVVWGQRGNFLSVPTDCPQRDERLGWMGDTQIFSRAATYNADVASFFHKWINDVRDSQQADGTYPSVVPDNWSVGYGRTAWAEAAVIVPWNMYQMYADTDILRDHYTSMERFMNWLSTQQFDGYLYNGGNTQYGDWLAYENTDARFISVAYYAYMARLMEKISKVLSQNSGDLYAQNVTKYNSLYNNIKAEFQKRYVSTRSGLLIVSTQTAYLLALANDLFQTPEVTQKAINFLVDKIKNNGNKLSTGFVGTGILNQTLSKAGVSDMAYTLLLQRNNPSWLYSVDQGATTIWERWNSYTIANGFGDPAMNSFNHYSYGAVSEWMYRYMAGIEVDENNPGFKHFILQPNPDTRDLQSAERITYVDATYGSFYGSVKSKWEQKTDGSYTYSVTVPANTSATLYILKLNSTSQIKQNGIPADKVPGVISYLDEGNRFALELESGSYIFDAFADNVSVSNIKENGKDIKIYPNPVRKGESMTIEANLADSSFKNAFLDIYSSIGEQIGNYQIKQKVTSLALNENSGTYLLVFRTNDKEIERIKLIVK
ncbi:MAG: family 78 glycoside hydrolase catalytic domain [Paludibacteraceae bacterium]